MAFQADLVTFLTANNALSELVGTRIYPRVMPQEPTLPLLVYNRITEPRTYSQSGDSGLENPRYQFDCWANDPDTSEQVAEALIEALSGFRGPMGETMIGGSFVENHTDGHDPETGLHRDMVEALLWKEN